MARGATAWLAYRRIKTAASMAANAGMRGISIGGKHHQYQKYQHHGGISSGGGGGGNKHQRRRRRIVAISAWRRGIGAKRQATSGVK